CSCCLHLITQIILDHHPGLLETVAHNREKPLCIQPDQPVFLLCRRIAVFLPLLLDNQPVIPAARCQQHEIREPLAHTFSLELGRYDLVPLPAIRHRSQSPAQGGILEIKPLDDRLLFVVLCALHAALTLTVSSPLSISRLCVRYSPRIM